MYFRSAVLSMIADNPHNLLPSNSICCMFYVIPYIIGPTYTCLPLNNSGCQSSDGIITQWDANPSIRLFSGPLKVRPRMQLSFGTSGRLLAALYRYIWILEGMNEVWAVSG